MRRENKRMQDFLAANGVTAVPKYLAAGSLKGCWRLYNGQQKWSEELRQKLIRLGFAGFDGAEISRFAGNGGLFSVFVRGHDELLAEEVTA